MSPENKGLSQEGSEFGWKGDFEKLGKGILVDTKSS
jgi:hypothetical protein